MDLALLEHCVRNDLGSTSARVMAVQKPLKIIFSNWDQNKTDELVMENHPDHPEMGTRTVSFGKEIYIEADDFMEDPPRKYFRLRPDAEKRRRYHPQ